MSKPKSQPTPPPLSQPSASFSIKRDGSGYAIYKIVIDGSKVLSNEKVTEPDMLPITLSKLQELVFKNVQQI